MKVRIGLIVCGANGEKGYVLEKAARVFGKDNFDRTIQLTATMVASLPLMVEMSGLDSSILVTVNGCGRKCCDRILEENQMSPKISVNMSDCIERKLGECKACSSFDFEEPSEDEIRKIADKVNEAVTNCMP